MAEVEEKAKSEIELERKLRLYAEQSRQELLKQQLLELELKRTTEQLRQEEEAARQRLFNVSAFAEQQVQNALIPYAPAPSPPPPGYGPMALIPPPPPSVSAPSIISHHSAYHHHHHCHDHHYHQRKHSDEEIAIRRHRRERHRCGRCDRLGHFSKECRSSPDPRHRVPSPAPSVPALARPAVKGYLTSASGSAVASIAGGYSTEDEDEGWQLIPRRKAGELYYPEPLEIDEDGYPVARRYREVDDEWEGEEDRRDNGVLVYYDGGGAPGTAWPRSTVRHVIGV